MGDKNNMLAKTVVKNKFWIVEDTDGERLGTIQKVANGSKDVVLVTKQRRTKFASIKVLGDKFNIKFARTSKPKVVTGSVTDVYGYPADGDVFNGVFDVSKNLPIYTKLEKSKSFFCAGYYLIKFNNRWIKNYCPKTLTLDRNEWKGPYKTEDEMKAVLEGVK